MRTLALLFLPACVACGCTCADPATPRRDAGTHDAGTLDASSADAASPMDATSTADATSPTDAASPADASGSDAPIAIDAGGAGGDAGCVPGTARTCALMCTTGGTAMGVERCLGGDTWTACARSPEACGNGADDDLDGTVDEGCRVEGGCMWLRPQCQGIMTLNDWCASAGGLRLVAGRRCAVAGGDVVPLSTSYGEYPLCCCDRVSMCVPECTDASCSGCVVWDEIQCCPP